MGVEYRLQCAEMRQAFHLDKGPWAGVFGFEAFRIGPGNVRPLTGKILAAWEWIPGEEPVVGLYLNWLSYRIYLWAESLEFHKVQLITDMEECWGDYPVFGSRFHTDWGYLHG